MALALRSESCSCFMSQRGMASPCLIACNLTASAAAPPLPSTFLLAAGRLGLAFPVAAFLSLLDLNSRKLTFRNAL